MALWICCLNQSAQPLPVHPLTAFTHTWGVGGCQPPFYSHHSNTTLSVSSPMYGRRWREERRRVGNSAGPYTPLQSSKKLHSFSFNPWMYIYLLVLLSWGACADPLMLLWAVQKNWRAETLHSRNRNIITPTCSLRLSFTVISLQAFYSFS